MASLTHERLKEMEAEMNRFEQEILTPGMGPKGGPPRMIIGANTFSKVQAQLSGDPHQGPGEEPEQIPLSVLSSQPPPPPPGSDSSSTPTPDPAPKSNLFLPPPPPPPIAPSFVPPQLRQRAPGPPMNRPPLPPRPPMHPGPFGPPMMRGGPPPPMRQFMGGPPGPYGPPIPPRSTQPRPASIEKPKVVYSAPPVRKVPKVDSTEAKVEAVEIGVHIPGVEKPESGHVEADEAGGIGELMEVIEGEAVPGTKKEKKEKKKKFVRTAAGTTWEDPTLAEWDTDDFRMFCGDLGNEVTDEHLARAFSKYPTFQKAKVIRDRRTNKTKGYGFVSFKDPNDFSRAMREMNGKYVGNRPIKLRKSSWKDRQIDIVRRKDKEKKRLGLR